MSQYIKAIRIVYTHIHELYNITEFKSYTDI